MSKRFFVWMLSCLVACSVWAKQPEGPIDVSADAMEYVGEKLVGTGNVVVTHQTATLRADKVTVDPDTGDSHAKGNVVLEQGDSTWEGDEVYYNFKTGVGDFGEFKATTGAFTITAKESERISENEVLLRDVTLTSCEEGDRPYYCVRTKECRLIDQHIIKAKHASVWLGKVPLFYVPYIRRDLDSGMLNTQIGKSGDLGFYARNRITYDLDDNLRAKTHIDFYEERGVGVGQDLSWKHKNGQTDFGLYYIDDDDGLGANNITPTSVDYGEYDSERYRIRMESSVHSEDDERDYFKGRVNVWSDPDVVENYFTEEYRERTQPESFVGVALSDDTSTFGISSVYQFSDAYETVNRLPAFSWDNYMKHLGHGVYYRNESEAVYLEKRDNNYATTPDEYESFRLDTYHELVRPFEMFDFLNVTPRASYRATYYSDTTVDDEDDIRNVFEVGAEASFKAHKVVSNAKRWYGDGLRHTVQPYVNYTYRLKPNMQPTNSYTSASSDILDFDDIDSLDEANEVAFGIRNILQTRSNSRTRKFVDFDLYTTLDLEPENEEDEFGVLNADVEFWFTENFNVEVDTEYNFYDNEYNPFNARMSYHREDGSSFSTEYRWREDFNHILMAQASLWPKSRYSVDTYVRYDFEEEQFEDSDIILKRKLDCMGVGLGYRRTEDDNQIWIYMWVLALGEDTPFGG